MDLSSEEGKGTSCSQKPGVCIRRCHLESIDHLGQVSGLLRAEPVFQPVGWSGGGQVGSVVVVLALSFFTHTPGGAVTVLPSW